MRYVNQPVMKKDGMALVTGKPVYTQDLAPKDCLVVKVLRSPHASAKIKSIDKSRAEKVEGIVCILTHEDCPNRRFTQAGQTFWEMSPDDRYILEDRVRFVGDAVAVIAGENEKAVKKAMKLVKVEYEVLDVYKRQAFAHHPGSRRHRPGPGPLEPRGEAAGESGSFGEEYCADRRNPGRSAD